MFKLVALSFQHRVKLAPKTSEQFIEQMINESSQITQNNDFVGDSKLAPRLHVSVIAKRVGISHDPLQGITTFSCYAPIRGNNPHVLRLWIPTSQYRTYQKLEIPMTQHGGSSFHYVALSGVRPMKGNDVGTLYQFVDSVTGEDVADPNAEFLPAGSAGKVASIVNHGHFSWGRDEWAWIVKGRKDPHHVTKVHVGTASKEGTFLGLKQALLKEHRFSDIDTLELLPVSEYSGNSMFISHFEGNTLRLEKAITPPTGSWGYDTCGFYGSVTALYGSPDDLKALVREGHRKDIKMSIDLQLNHLGPSGTSASNYFQLQNKNTDSSEQTPWGASLNYSDPFVRAWVLRRVKQFLETYHFDAIRLDMTEFLRDDSFLFELGHLITEHTFSAPGIRIRAEQNIPAHAEDARSDIKPLVDPLKGHIDNVWLFKMKNLAQELISGGQHRLDLLDTFCNLLLDERKGITFFTSHDEQGNGDGFQERNALASMLLTLGRGIPLEFPYPFWHFFRDGDNPVDGGALLAEKVGLLGVFKEKDWGRLTQYHPYFANLQDLKAFALSFHAKYFKAIPDYIDRTKAIRKLIETDAPIAKGLSGKDLPTLIDAHFKQIVDLIRDQDFNIDKTHETMMQHLRKLRKQYPWLTYCDSPEDFKIVENGLAILSRSNPFNSKEQVVALTNWSNEAHIRNIPANQLLKGSWRIVAQSGDHLIYKNTPLPESFPIRSNTGYELLIPAYSGVVLERVTKTHVDVDWADILQIFNPTQSAIIHEPRGPFSDLQEAGEFLYQGQLQHFGFTPGQLHIRYNPSTPIQIRAIFFKDPLGVYKKIDDFHFEYEENHLALSLEDVKVGMDRFNIDGASADKLFVNFMDGSVVSFTVPK